MGRDLPSKEGFQRRFVTSRRSHAAELAYVALAFFRPALPL